MSKELLKVREVSKKKKPRFSTDDSASRKRLDANKWTKPRGSDSKMRKGLRGHKKQPSVGYSSPNAVKGLNRQGLQEVVIYSMKDIEQNFSGKCAVISSSVGGRKKILLLEKLQEKDIPVSSVKDVVKSLEALKKGFEERRKSNKKKKTEKQKAKAEVSKKKEEKAQKEEAKSEKKEVPKETKKEDVKKDEPKK